MHRTIPNIYIFIDRYDDDIFKYNNTNIGIIYRNYKKLLKISELIKIAKACKKNRYKFFISNNIKLAVKLKADGIYIPAFNKIGLNFHYLDNKKLIVLGSAHNIPEIIKQINNGCSGIFLSPLFKVKKSKKYLGVNKFNLFSRSKKIKIYALGGINNKNFSRLKMLNIQGVAGISLFKKKTGLIKGRFL